jgi:hypothetical protein
MSGGYTPAGIAIRRTDLLPCKLIMSCSGRNTDHVATPAGSGHLAHVPIYSEALLLDSLCASPGGAG